MSWDDSPYAIALPAKRKSAKHRERQLPDRALIPDRADHHAQEPRNEMLHAALLGLFPPVPVGDPDSGDSQRNEQRRKQPADTAHRMLVGPADQKCAGVIELERG